MHRHSAHCSNTSYLESSSWQYIMWWYNDCSFPTEKQHSNPICLVFVIFRWIVLPLSHLFPYSVCPIYLSFFQLKLLVPIGNCTWRGRKRAHRHESACFFGTERTINNESNSNMILAHKIQHFYTIYTSKWFNHVCSTTRAHKSSTENTTNWCDSWLLGWSERVKSRTILFSSE